MIAETLESVAGGTVRIERVETCLVDLPTIRPHKLSVAVMNGQTLMLVKVYCTDGTVGVGEGTTIGGTAYGGESPESMKLNIDTYLAPVMLGQDANRVQAVMARVARMAKDNRFAKSALETALLDALGQRTGLALSELLGGRRRDRLPVAWTLASGDTGRDIAEAERFLDERRHNIFKLKIGAAALRDDVRHVAAIKRAVGDAASVRVDVNMAWGQTEAAWGMAALADVGCELVEQPVATAAGLVQLKQRGFAIPLMADESITGPQVAYELAKAGAADVFAIKIEQNGGLHAAQRTAAIADAAGIELYGGTMLEGAVSTVASAHLFSTFAELAWGTELFGPLLLTEDILAQPLQYHDFALTVPEGPGLGLIFDDDKIRRHTRCGYTKITHA